MMFDCVLDAAWHGPRASVLSRLLAALIDAGAVILLATALAWVAGMDWPATTAIVALAYFSLATALFAESPAKWALSRGRFIFDALTQGPAAIAAAWRHGVDTISHVLPSADGLRGGRRSGGAHLDLRCAPRRARALAAAPRAHQSAAIDLALTPGT